MHTNAEYYLTTSELQRLIDGASSIRDKALIALFVDTGIRRFEASELLASDVDFKEKLILVRNGKGNKLRMLPMSPRLVRYLKELTEPGVDKPLFRSKTNENLGIRQVNRIVALAAKYAKIKNPNPRYANVTCHLIRHSFARHWKEVGGNIETLAKILGHSSVKTTWDMYGTQSVADVRKNYRDTIN
ncbi:MAG TPA: tyrosine-type recombinase/integrase, partial [candidate division Zixibacteria bacterium]|nr:tyrosine-type recombinase/integrase [candidate division Zixibacteria bacterium]